MKLRFQGNGVEIDGGLLWIDAPAPKRLSVVTHAHGDHVARHESILCTPATAELIQRRAGRCSKFIQRNYGEATVVGDRTVTLLCAGHILGSAMALVEGPGERLLFTGDVRLDGGLTCPPAQPVPADLLITESTFGRSDHRMPPAHQVRAEIVAFAREALASERTPVFLAYALGKAQELMAILTGANIPVSVHGSAFHLCRIYRQFGLRFPGARKLGSRTRRRDALIVPPRFLATPEVRRAVPQTVAAVTGWGDRTLQPGVDRSFPLSDHSDFDGLVRIAQIVKPRKVYTLHGYAVEFAAELERLGFDAEAVPGHRGPSDQERPGMFGPIRGYPRRPPNTP